MERVTRGALRPGTFPEKERNGLREVKRVFLRTFLFWAWIFPLQKFQGREKVAFLLQRNPPQGTHTYLFRLLLFSP